MTTADTSGAMTPERWDRIAEVFEAAVALPTDERVEFLDRACRDDHVVRAEVDAMLGAHDNVTPLRIEQRLLAPPETSLAPGTRVGPYRVDALVKEGGMGEVYRAERVDGEYRQTVTKRRNEQLVATPGRGPGHRNRQR